MNFKKISFFAFLCTLVSLNGYEQKVTVPSNVDKNLIELDPYQYKWNKLVNYLASRNSFDDNDQETENISEDNDYNIEKRARSLFLGKRAAKPRNIFLGQIKFKQGYENHYEFFQIKI